MTSRIHHMLPSVDQREIEVDGDFPFARAEGLTQYAPIRRDDRREATTRYRSDLAARVLHDLRLLVSIQPGSSANHKAPRLQCMLPHIDFRLLCKRIAKHGAGVHRRVNLLAIGHHRVPCERVVVLKTRQLPDACDLAVNGPQT